MSFTLNNDKKTGALHPKGQWLFPITQFIEVNRLGEARYPAVKAQGILTAAGNASNGETVVIGSKVYSFVTTLSGVDGQVKIGSTKEETLANLAAAINLTGVPNSQYTTQTTLNTLVSARVSGATLIATAKTGGTAGNSIATTETCANMSWDAATLGTARAGAEESDADSIIHPHYYGSVNVQTAQQYNIRDSMYHGAGEIDGSDDRVWSNKNVVMNYPMRDYQILAGATRKLFTPNHWDRNVKSFDTFMVKSFMQRPLWQTLNSPFTENTGNITFHTVEMGDDRFALFYRQAAGTTGIYVVIGQMQNNGTVTWGTPALVTARDQYDLNFDAILVATDKLLAVFGNGASDFMATSTITVTGTTVSVNTPVQVVATAFSWKKLVKLNTDKALLSVYTGTTMSIYVVTVTGTVPSYGTVVNQTTSINPIMVANGTDKVQVVYQDTAASRLRSAVITVVGTTPTIQASTLIGYEVSAGYKVQQLIQVATDKFVYYHPQGQLHPYRGRDRVKLIFLTVSGNTTTAGSTKELANTIYDGNITYIKNISGNDYLLYNHAQRRAAKLVVNTTNNTVDINDVPFRVSTWDDSTTQTINMFKYAETNNIQRMADPAFTTKGVAFCATDNNVNGAITLWTDKTFSFEVYIDDELYGTYTKSLPGVIEGVQVRINLNRLEVPMKIKNTGTVDLFFMMTHIIASLD